MLTQGSLFSGIGGFDLAAEQVGWKNIFHCEKEFYQQGILKKRFKESILYEDIKNFIATKYRDKIDVLTGGFPCQDISPANYNSSGIVGQRSGLWSEYARIISEIRPKFVVIENSPNLLRKGFEKVLYDLSEAGYDAEWQCLSAEAFGFPHQRERLFIVAYPNGFRQSGSRYLFENASYNPPSREWETNRVINAIQRKTLPPLCDSNNGFSTQLALTGLGNAIIPDIAVFVFKLIEKFILSNNQ